MPTYGGDEVSAVVLDIGTNTTRAGYAGEDVPKVVIPTWYGYIPGSKTNSLDSNEEQQPKYYFGDHGPNIWRPKMEILNPLKDSIVEDWNATEQMMRVIFEREMRLGCSGAELEVDEKRGILTENPLLVTEPSWNSKENRERMIELAFEEFDTPAYYSVDRAVMCAFAAGRGSALVVDIGDELTTVTPVCDGFVLRKGIQKSPIAGNLLSKVLLSTIETKLTTEIYPQYLVKTKAFGTLASVDQTNNDQMMSGRLPSVLNLPTGLVLREDRLPRLSGESLTTVSFHEYHKMKLMHEVKESIFEMFPRTWDEEAISNMPVKSFEFPTGQIHNFGRERCAIPEILMDNTFIPENEKPNYNNKHTNNNNHQNKQQTNQSTINTIDINMIQSISELIQKSLNMMDTDLQIILSLNIIIIGGSSLINGLNERIENRLKLICSGLKFKIFSFGNLYERNYCSWLGGSILGSLGTFHQLWIGKDEYKEQGRSIVHRRCK